ncbi:MAG: hypothetical protein WC501_01545 [Candidatus Micrarchaeia archaeon]
MVNITITISSELKSIISKYPEINWSEVARQAWREKIMQLDMLNEITRKSKVTEKDIVSLAANLKKSMAQFHEK